MDSHIVNKLWKRNEPPYWGVIASLDRNRAMQNWHDEYLADTEWADFHLENIEQPMRTDLFFSPLVYEKPRRLVTLHKPATILFADLDKVHPRDVEFSPHIAWETSGGNFQAVWLLSKPIKYRTQFADLNRRMTYHTGADKGGWAGSKVLRIPGTKNWKRDGATGGLLWEDWDERPYTYAYLDHKLMPSTMIHDPSVVGEAPPITQDHAALQVIWRRLPSRAQWRLTQRGVKDRSKYIVATAHLLHEEGVTIEDAYVMLWYAPFNKWRQRNNPQRLWIELNRVYEESTL